MRLHGLTESAWMHKICMDAWNLHTCTDFAWTHRIFKDAALKLDKVVELVGGGSVINSAYHVQFTELTLDNRHVSALVHTLENWHLDGFSHILQIWCQMAGMQQLFYILYRTGARWQTGNSTCTYFKELELDGWQKENPPTYFTNLVIDGGHVAAFLHTLQNWRQMADRQEHLYILYRTRTRLLT